MKVVVLGSGILGVSTAWWLQKAGHEVVVVDRQAGSAQETSFANGCQISVSFSEPWAKPSAPWQALKWMFRSDAPLLFKMHADWNQWKWMAAFLRECTPSQFTKNVQAMLALSTYSRTVLQEMRQELDIPYHALTKGILNFYRTQEDFEASQKAAEIMRQYGVDRRIVSTEEILQIEPAMRSSRDKIVGGDYTQSDETGDIYAFTVRLAELAKAAGVQFLYSTQATRLITDDHKISSVEIITDHGGFSSLKADAYVVALGSYSNHLLHPIKVPCLVYPTKGYSGTYKITDPDNVPYVSITDSANKVVFARIGDYLRIAGTAEMAGYSRTLNTVRCGMLERTTRELFGSVVDCDHATYWTGLRPSTPSNVPLVGRTQQYSNLFLNTGHGTLGWTMGVGSGKALADIISSKKTEVHFPFIGV